ncbi:CHAT domain-containing protein, partial [Planktothrix sp. FACHB-1355]|uniref:CHAT domain-containing protein n=1 Tax=Planktothrix sp. FACHB-1355 TaxID=2692854 RepID=UPI00168BAD6B
EEPQILQANSELLDLGFVQVCEAVAAGLAEEGKQNEADFLRSVASQLGEFLGMNDEEDGDNSEGENTEKYVEFILELLHAEESYRDISVVYPILDRGKHLLNVRFAAILNQVAVNLIAKHPEATREIIPIIGNLSIHISGFPRGKRANNIEIGIAGYQIVLNNLEPGSELWATAQNNLAIAYHSRIRGEKADNLEQAIEFYTATLTIYTREAFPQEWATTQNNLGNAYWDRIKGEKADNLELAIASYTAASEVRTREAFPQDWAGTQNNLAVAYSNRIKGEKADNLEKAIAYYTAALTVYTRDAFPEKWAMMQNNVANAYRNRIKGDKVDNIEKAIKCYRQALEIRTPSAFPLDCLDTGRNLGNLAFELQDWNNAIYGYEKAIAAVEQSRDWAGTEAAKREIQENAIEVYFRMLQACINAQNLTKAVETAERSKARNLVELLANRDLYPKGDIPQEILTRLDSLRRDIPAIQRQLGQKSTSQLSESNNDTQKQLRDELTKLQQQLDSVLEQIKPFDPNFSFTQKVEPILHSEIQSLVADNTAIIEWYITEDKFATFVITSTSPQIQLWQSSEQDLKDLGNWAIEYLTDYTDEKDANKTQWRQNLATRLQRLAEILHLDEIIKLVPPTVDKLVLIPHRFLHLFPLHALNLTKTAHNNSYCLLDRFPQGVSYAPSCQLLQRAQMRQRPNFSHLFAIQNPTKDLTYANLEVQTIQQHFNPQDILIETAAKKAVIDNNRLSIADCIHFSCHGYFNFENPLLSALLLADCELPPPPPNPDPNRYLPLKNNKTLDLKQCLTLADIFDLDLRACRLVVLSACETGITDFSSLSDEYIGLPSGFLVAGSPGVVCSLWSVSDLSTAFLLIRFYRELTEQPSLSVPVALKKAQNWLRNLSREDLLKELDTLKLDTKRREGIERWLKLNGNPAFPFEDPAYWAAFCAIGL